MDKPCGCGQVGETWSSVNISFRYTSITGHTVNMMGIFISLANIISDIVIFTYKMSSLMSTGVVEKNENTEKTSSSCLLHFLTFLIFCSCPKHVVPSESDFNT